jgi:multiple sugar transport system substrate-binding protein
MSKSIVTRARARLVIACLVVAGALFALAACGGSSDKGSTASGGGSSGSVDDGSKITMWTRAATSAYSQLLVDAYNKTHKNQVKLTVIPTDSYQPKIAAAAGGHSLPDVLSADVVFVPNYSSKGLLADLTSRVNALKFKDALAPGHIKASTYQGKIYAVPHDIDLSAMFYNKVLFKKAGLDPEKPPTTVKEMVEAARKINALGGGVHGFYFGGNCGGCLLFTTWPMIWASGGTVLNEDGTQSTVNNPQAAEIYGLYKQMSADGIVDKQSKNEPGATWTAPFSSGKVGIQPEGATILGTIKENKNLQVGVAPIPGLDGGESSFVGGDVLGIASTSKKTSAAWNFIAWTLSDEAQVNVAAKAGYIPSRSDLADNQYAQKDPRLVTFNKLVGKGQTPATLNFGPTYNDPNGPWLESVRAAIYGGDPKSELDKHNGAINTTLQGGG